MKKFSALIIISIIVFGFFILWMLLPEKNRTNTSPQSFNPPLLINGLSYNIYNNGTLMSKMEADEFKIRPRKFFIFNIKSINEAILKNVKMDIYIKDPKIKRDQKIDIDLLKLFFDSTTDKKTGAGLITRALIKGIDMNIYNADVLTHKLKASTAEFMLRSKKIIFYNVNLENPLSQKLIHASKIHWDAQEKVFRITDWYEVSSPKGKSKGKGLTIDLHFNIKSI